MTGSVQLLQKRRSSAAVCNPTNANKEEQPQDILSKQST